MKIQFLGTAAAEGWPGLFCRCAACAEARKRGGKNIRSRSQAIIDDKLLIDYPSDTFMHMVNNNIDLPNIKSCIVTHTHEDHFYPAEMVMRGPWFANEIDDVPFTVYGNDSLMQIIETRLALDGPAGQIPGFIAWKELDRFTPVEIEGYRVTPMSAEHNRPEKCFIFLIEKDGETILYGNDTAMFPEDTWAFLAETKPHLNLVSLDCTFLVNPDGATHMGIDGCLKTRDRLIELGCADENTTWVINHFSHNGGIRATDGKLFLHEELEELMAQHNFLVAYDGKTVFSSNCCRTITTELSPSW